MQRDSFASFSTELVDPVYLNYTGTVHEEPDEFETEEPKSTFPTIGATLHQKETRPVEQAEVERVPSPLERSNSQTSGRSNPRLDRNNSRLERNNSRLDRFSPRLERTGSQRSASRVRATSRSPMPIDTKLERANSQDSTRVLPAQTIARKLSDSSIDSMEVAGNPTLAKGHMSWDELEDMAEAISPVHHQVDIVSPTKEKAEMIQVSEPVAFHIVSLPRQLMASYEPSEPPRIATRNGSQYTTTSAPFSAGSGSEHYRNYPAPRPMEPRPVDPRQMAPRPMDPRLVEPRRPSADMPPKPVKSKMYSDIPEGTLPRKRNFSKLYCALIAPITMQMKSHTPGPSFLLQNSRPNITVQFSGIMQYEAQNPNYYPATSYYQNTYAGYALNTSAYDVSNTKLTRFTDYTFQVIAPASEPFFAALDTACQQTNGVIKLENRYKLTVNGTFDFFLSWFQGGDQTNTVNLPCPLTPQQANQLHDFLGNL
ncbi:hypothetical protein EDD86DRAFT_247563 [Gorgonomyces haynaldii]|nr:hypothetical protein EDD86DRAFT_247563 [Gorgonomyces haynaldii]